MDIDINGGLACVYGCGRVWDVGGGVCVCVCTWLTFVLTLGPCRSYRPSDPENHSPFVQRVASHQAQRSRYCTYVLYIHTPMVEYKL